MGSAWSGPCLVRWKREWHLHGSARSRRQPRDGALLHGSHSRKRYTTTIRRLPRRCVVERSLAWAHPSAGSSKTTSAMPARWLTCLSSPSSASSSERPLDSEPAHNSPQRIKHRPGSDLQDDALSRQSGKRKRLRLAIGPCRIPGEDVGLIDAEIEFQHVPRFPGKIDLIQVGPERVGRKRRSEK